MVVTARPRTSSCVMSSAVGRAIANPAANPPPSAPIAVPTIAPVWKSGMVAPPYVHRSSDSSVRLAPTVRPRGMLPTMTPVTKPEMSASCHQRPGPSVVTMPI